MPVQETPENLLPLPLLFLSVLPLIHTHEDNSEKLAISKLGKETSPETDPTDLDLRLPASQTV